MFNGALGTIGHEYQHLINASRRIWVNEATILEETWLNEALSHIGEELLFYAAAGIEPRSNVSESHLQSGRLLEAINRFGIQNLIRYGLYLEDVTDDSPTDRGDNLATRGAAWSFLRYLGDHQQNRTDVTLFRELVDAKVAGFQNLTRALDEDPLLWVQRWGISVYTDDFAVSLTARPLYQQPSWDFRSLLPQLFGGFPLDVRTLRHDAELDFDVKSGTSGYVEFSSAPGVGSQVEITSNGALPPSQLRITVVRTD